MAGRVTGTTGPHRRRIAAVAVAVSLLATACGGDDEPELTFEDRLVELEGRSLTPAEVAERVEIGETLCRLDDQVLDEMWQQLSDEQLDFQDLIVAELCPERAILYAGHTGRFVTEEAEESGVRTSTTRPTSTTATTPRPTTTRPTTATSSGVTGSSTASSAPSATSSTDPAPPSTSTTSTVRPTTSTTSTTGVTQTSSATGGGPPSSR